MVRVVGDGCIASYIHDLIVSPSHQRTGIGSALMRRCLELIKERGGGRIVIGLMAAKGADAFYQKFGFTSRPGDAPGMQMLVWK